MVGWGGVPGAPEMRMGCILTFPGAPAGRCLGKQEPGYYRLKPGCPRISCSDVFPGSFTLHLGARKRLSLWVSLNVAPRGECQRKNVHGSPGDGGSGFMIPPPEERQPTQAGPSSNGQILIGHRWVPSTGPRARRHLGETPNRFRSIIFVSV